MSSFLADLSCGNIPQSTFNILFLFLAERWLDGKFSGPSLPPCCKNILSLVIWYAFFLYKLFGAVRYTISIPNWGTVHLNQWCTVVLCTYQPYSRWVGFCSWFIQVFCLIFTQFFMSIKQKQKFNSGKYFFKKISDSMISRTSRTSRTSREWIFAYIPSRTCHPFAYISSLQAKFGLRFPAPPVQALLFFSISS